MSVYVSAWCWRHSKSKGTDRLVLLAIADQADDDGANAFPSYVTLAERCGGISTKTVQRSTQRLEELGELAIEQHGGPPREGPTKQRSNRYAFPAYQAAQKGGQDVQSSKPQVGASQRERVDISGERVDTAMSSYPSLDPPTTKNQTPKSKPSATAHADAGGVDPTVEAGGSTATARRTSRTAPAEVGTQSPAESIMEGEGATVTDLFGGQPPAGKSRKRGKAPDPDAEARAKNAGDVVAAWVDAYRTTGAEPPGYRCGQVGKEAKALLAAGNSVERLIESAKNAGRQGWWSLERELTAAARVAGYRQAQPNRIRDFKSPALADQHVYDGQL